ncbi:hypothetical protein DL96DRAFT_1706915 [Flagelloscypha sp. PMI_526]|nr:hypothetical protein DL96DRAFT_1706915 [Flagelloscypha sp. PMI_526]
MTDCGTKKRKFVHPEATSGSYTPSNTHPSFCTVSATSVGSSASLSGHRVQRSTLTQQSTTHVHAPLPSLALPNQDNSWSYAPVPDGGRGPEDEEEDGILSDKPEVVEQVPQQRRYLSSDNPMLVWNSYKENFLDALFFHEALNYMSPDRTCTTCNTATECFILCDDCSGGLECVDCSLQSHRRSPLHSIKEWSGNFWKCTSLSQLGYVFHLGHNGSVCPAHNSSTTPTQMTVLDSNGIHEVLFSWCFCTSPFPNRVEQCLRASFYPSSCDKVQTCATFCCLDFFCILNVAGGINATDFVTSLSRKTDGSRLETLPVHSKQFLNMSRQWAWLLRTKRAGYGFKNHRVASMRSYAVECWACPHPDKNLPTDWEKVPCEYCFLFILFLALDANFQLKNKLRKNAKDDPPITDGVGYFTKTAKYQDHVLKHVGEVKHSTCLSFHAMKWDNRKTTGLRATGKGERYANMDFIFFSALCTVAMTLSILVSYDIACQWSKNLTTCMEKLPPQLQRSSAKEFIRTGLPVWHATGHEAKCRMANSLTLMEGAGRSDGEGIERVWSRTNPIASLTKEQGEGSRCDNLDDKFDYENTCCNLSLVDRLPIKLIVAIEEVEKETAAFADLDGGVTGYQRDQWLSELEDWQSDKQKPNPYVLDTGDELSEHQIHAELLQSDVQEALSGAAAGVQSMSPSSFLMLGLDIEEAQIRIRVDAKKASNALSAELIKLNQRWYTLAKKLTTFRAAQRIYMPGAIQAMEVELMPPKAVAVELVKLWLPSDLPAETWRAGCAEQLPEKELKLRKDQVMSVLRDLRKWLYSQKLVIEKRNLCGHGQVSLTHSAVLSLDASASSSFPELLRSDLIIPTEDNEDADARQRLNAAGGNRVSCGGANSSQDVSCGPGWIWHAVARDDTLPSDIEGSAWLSACCCVEWLKA